jgi:DNA-binding XRE family transcriptional regulator
MSKLKEYRIAHSIAQIELAKILGISKQSYSRKEISNYFTVEEANAICKFLKCSYEDIFFE